MQSLRQNLRHPQESSWTALNNLYKKISHSKMLKALNERGVRGGVMLADQRDLKEKEWENVSASTAALQVCEVPFLLLNDFQNYTRIYPYFVPNEISVLDELECAQCWVVMAKNIRSRSQVNL